MADTAYSGVQYDARTGERLPADWRTPKTIPADMSAINMDAVNANIQNLGTEQAVAAIDAAIQFQGLRGYQQALKNGESADKAMAKYGPMIFRKTPQAFPPSLKALTPPTPRPENPLSRERFEFQKNQPIHVGQGLYKMDASGKPVQLVAPPEKPVPFAIDTDMLGKDKMVRLTPKQFSEQISTLPPYAQTNAANLAQLRAAGLSPATNSIVPPSAPPMQAASEIVVMINPKGQKVKVPKTEIERAKKLGYK